MDIGSSTTAHQPDREAFFPDGHKALLNWGRWHRCLNGDYKGYPPQPMFREYRSGYPTTRGLPPVFNEDTAIALDRVMACKLTRREIAVLLCHYCYQQSARQAAVYLTRNGIRCNHNKYLGWIDSAVGRVDIIIGE